MPISINRRGFLKTAGAAGAVVSWGEWTDSRARASSSPNEKLNIAIIGAGGRGAANLEKVAGENIVALCDVDERRAGATFERYPQVKRYHDFRRMLEEMEREIDAVVVSAPNHIHVPASVMAMRMGKHCYCEKPLAHSVHEARLVAKVAAETKVATQMGTQIHASDNYRRIVELLRAGAIGPVREVRIRLAGGKTAGDRLPETPVPQGLMWDLWLGPAPYRPYHPGLVPHDWHYWWDYGAGPLGNMGCHYLDLAFWALKLVHPATIESTGSPRHPESTPALQSVHYGFPARGGLPPVKLTWDHGHRRPPFWAEHNVPDWAWGVFVGSKGMLLTSYDRYMLWPESAFQGFEPPEPSIPPSAGHHQEWITACKTGSTTTCNFDYAGAVTEAVLLGNVAYRHGKQIEWDAENLCIPNAPNAEQYLQREYRQGWKL
jgi:predicted dehydrogenase